MPIIRSFIHYSTKQELQSYFSNHKAFEKVDWSQRKKLLTTTVVKLFDHQPKDVQTRINLDLERIKHMTDEVGQAALLSIFQNSPELLAHKSASERSLWAFQNHRNKFRRAEDIRYADQHRHGRCWSSYQAGASLTLHKNFSSMGAFKTKIKALFGLGEKIKIDRFERTIPGENDQDIKVIQIVIYQEGMPGRYLAFEEDKDEQLVSKIWRPVCEHAIIYTPSSGVIELVAPRREHRDLIAKAFTENLLKQTVGTTNRVPLRRYNLKPLMNNPTLNWDAEDGIESVQLVMIKLTDLKNYGRLQIEVPAKSKMGLYDYIEKYFRNDNPLTSEQFVPTQAKINIRFRPNNGRGRGKVLPIKITMPGNCDLRSRTDKERLIGHKYLKRWGLLDDL